MDFDLELYQRNKSTQQTGIEQSHSKVCKVKVDSYFTPLIFRSLSPFNLFKIGPRPL